MREKLFHRWADWFFDPSAMSHRFGHVGSLWISRPCFHRGFTPQFAHGSTRSMRARQREGRFLLGSGFIGRVPPQQRSARGRLCVHVSGGRLPCAQGHLRSSGAWGRGEPSGCNASRPAFASSRHTARDSSIHGSERPSQWSCSVAATPCQSCSSGARYRFAEWWRSSACRISISSSGMICRIWSSTTNRLRGILRECEQAAADRRAISSSVAGLGFAMHCEQ